MLAAPPFLHRNSALFLDFDGTIVDIAARPDAVVVKPGMLELLDGLSRRLNGALAVVSGRSIAELDNFLHPLVLPTAGVHGSERRDIEGVVTRLKAPVLTDAALRLQAFVADHDGLLLERKPGSLALHYRLAPEYESACLHAMNLIAEEVPGTALMHGKMVIELKPALASKSLALRAFMRERPFAGRDPLFAGDDVTDEDGFETLQSLGGGGVKVGAGETHAKFRVAGTTTLREWLACSLRLVDGEGGATGAGAKAPCFASAP
jgi:trehalose 6-phosphate phosphatase